MGRTNKNNGKPSDLEVKVSETVTVHETIKTKGKRNGERKPFREQIVGDDFCNRDRKWYSKERIIDRDNDKYKETLIDPDTGQVIHHCEEPLSSHRGHGAAKVKKKENAPR